MSSELDLAPWVKLEELIEAGEPAAVLAEIDVLGPRDSARAISRLSAEGRAQILTLLEPEKAADLLEELPDAQATDLVRHLAPEVAADILSEMSSDESADVLGELDEEQLEEILQEMDREAAEDARRLVSYPADVAGGLMITELLAFPERATTGEVIDDLRRHADEYAHYSIQYSYVVDQERKLLGVLPLRDLLMTPALTPIHSIMIKNPLFVCDTDSLESLTEFFDERDFLGVPVLDAERRLVGVLRRRDFREALGDKAQQDYLRSQGIVEEELRSMPLWLRSKRRLSWLSANILLNLCGATVIAFYQDTLAQVIALAVFLPIISDMSGCSGNQAVAVSMRELSLGLIKPLDLVHVWLKEASVGIINGLVLGILIAVVALAYEGNLFFGLVVGAALALNTLLAVSMGGIIPLAMRRLRVDPALASGPLLTTITDMCGFFLILSLASLFMPYLAGGE
ncbi:MAG: magnesium transporter [Candidatus Hydrogenedentes bacterium]|nr:magnesium transporter [Candidatus Hydrogenedentota bacterium]